MPSSRRAFVIMPFGRKKAAELTDIDFDTIYDKPPGARRGGGRPDAALRRCGGLQQLDPRRPSPLSYGLQRLSFVALWNGEPGDGPGGTESMVALVRKLTGHQPIIIAPATL
jgi:hypothetical protein